MTIPRFIIMVALVVAGSSDALEAQETRGALVPDTLVALADGTRVAVQDLEVGAALWSGGPQKSGPRLISIRRQRTDSYVQLKAGDRELEATGSQRVALSGGKLVRLDSVRVGDQVEVVGPKGLQDAVVSSLRVFPANLIGFDLTVEDHLPFLAGDFLVGD